MEIAPLGQVAPINLGGYIPAPRENRQSAIQQALTAFLTGAAGGAGQHLVGAAFTPDVSETAAKDTVLQEQGMAPGKRGAMAKFFQPLSQEDYMRMKGVAGQQSDRAKSFGLEKTRVGNEAKAQEVAANQRNTEIGLRSSEMDRASERDTRNFTNANQQWQQEMDMKKGDLARLGTLSAAQGKNLDTESALKHSVLRTQNELAQGQAFNSLVAGRPEEQAMVLKQAAQALASVGKTVDTYPNTAAWQTDVVKMADDMAKRQIGTTGAISPQGTIGTLKKLVAPWADSMARNPGMSDATMMAP